MVMYDNCYGSEPKGIFVDLTYDSGFKAVFADEANKTLLIGLLNEVLPPQAQISDIEKYYSDREQGKDTRDGKLTKLDLICKGTDGTTFIVEVQRENRSGFFQRCVFYAAGAFHRQLKAKERYSILKPVYIVAFLNYRMQHLETSLWNTNNIVSYYSFTEKRTGEAAPPTISIIFAELERFTKSERECKTDRDWLFYIFKHSSSLIDIPEAIREKPFFNQLLEACRIAAFDEQKKTKYEKAMLDERDILEIKDYAFEQGLEKGKAKGREEGLAEGRKEAVNETAKAMLADGMPVETVAKYTGLTAEMIGNLA